MTTIKELFPEMVAKREREAEKYKCSCGEVFPLTTEICPRCRQKIKLPDVLTL